MFFGGFFIKIVPNAIIVRGISNVITSMNIQNPIVPTLYKLRFVRSSLIFEAAPGSFDEWYPKSKNKVKGSLDPAESRAQCFMSQANVRPDWDVPPGQ